jgi:acyl-homoserine lactone synthase
MVRVFKGRKALKQAGIEKEFGQLRYRTFIEEMAWPLSHIRGQEWDVYDTDYATYILAFDKNGAISGGIRMLPTTEPFLMQEVFGHLVDDSILLPKGPVIMEITRYFVRSDIVASRKVVETAGSILCAMLEWSLDEGLEKILIVSDMKLFPQLKEVGWNARPLGLPQEFGGGLGAVGGGSAVALEVEISDDMLLSTAHRRRIQLPVLKSSTRPIPRRIPVLN